MAMGRQRIKTAWTIRSLNKTTYLIREKDEYGEFPHIYARPISLSNKTPSSSSTTARVDVILLIDTGCGTKAAVEPTEEEVQSSGLLSRLGLAASRSPSGPLQASPGTMTLHSFLSTWPVPELGDKPLNLNGKTPYLVALSHCHYDHIMGLTYFPTSEPHLLLQESIPTFSRSSGDDPPVAPKVTVMSSSNAASFISPRYPNLYEHSLCKRLNLNLPKYEIGYWSRHKTQIIWPPPTYVKYPDPKPLPWSSPDAKATDFLSHGHGTGIYTYHTPGHTPDSLSIYDSISRYLYIGDMIYERETPETRAAGEPPMAIVFERNSSLKHWFLSVRSLLKLVDGWNNEYSGVWDEEDVSTIEVVRELTSKEIADNGYLRTIIDQQPGSSSTSRYNKGESLLSVRKESEGKLVARHNNFFDHGDTLLLVKGLVPTPLSSPAPTSDDESIHDSDDDNSRGREPENAPPLLQDRSCCQPAQRRRYHCYAEDYLSFRSIPFPPSTQLGPGPPSATSSSWDSDSGFYFHSRSRSRSNSCSSTSTLTPSSHFTWTNLTLVHHELPLTHSHRVLAASAHSTASTDASSLLSSALNFLDDIVEERVRGGPVNRREYFAQRTRKSASISSQSTSSLSSPSSSSISPATTRAAQQQQQQPPPPQQPKQGEEAQAQAQEQDQWYFYHLTTPTGEETGRFSVLTPLEVVTRERQRRQRQEECQGEREREREGREKERKRRQEKNKNKKINGDDGDKGDKPACAREASRRRGRGRCSCRIEENENENEKEKEIESERERERERRRRERERGRGRGRIKEGIEE